MRAILTIIRRRTTQGSAAVLVLMVAGLAACTDASGKPDGGRPVVVASVYPLAEAARRVGGPCVEVVDLTPPGVEPHDLELSPDALEAIVTADLIVYVGGGFQPSVADAVGEASGVVVDALDGVPTLRAGSTVDPHAWLDPSRFAGMVDRIRRGLDDLGIAGSCDTASRAAAFRDELVLLDAEFATGLHDCRSRDIVSSHGAFTYLADAYGLRQKSITGVDPAAEPSAERLAELREELSRDGVLTLFTEILGSPRVARTLASEVGATIAVLDPLETEPSSGGYVGAMHRNLRTLRGALGCA